MDIQEKCENEVEYRVYGGVGKPAVVLVPPVITVDLLEPLALTLSESYSVISCSTRGMSTPFSGNIRSVTTDSFVNDVFSIVVAEGAGPFTLIGFCSGAQIACAFAARYPDLVENLILVAPGTPIKWGAAGAMTGNAKYMYDTSLAIWNDEDLAKSILEQLLEMPVLHGRPENEFSSSVNKKMFVRDNDSFRRMFLLYYQLFTDEKWCQCVSRVKAPTMIVLADGDEMLDRSNIERLSGELPNCKGVEFVFGSHMSFTLSKSIHIKISQLISA